MAPKTIIFDIDGTLCDVSSIRHLVGGKNKNFDAFHRASVDCPTFEWVANVAKNAKNNGFTVVQVTARQEKYRPQTSWWLADHGIPSDALYMRKDGDYRADYIVKSEILSRIAHLYDIKKAYDDNPNIVRLWEENNIRCVVVPGWDEDDYKTTELSEDNPI